MKTAAIKIKTYAKEVNSVVTDSVSVRKSILRGIFASSAVLAVCYVIILGSMVFNIVERKGLENNARNLSNEVSELELQYLNMSKSIDLSLAASKGFKETDVKKFATRKALGSITFAKNDL